MTIYCYEYDYADEDSEYPSEIVTAYFLAQFRDDADKQFQEYVHDREPTNVGWYAHDEIEYWGLAHKIMSFAFGRGDDNLLLEMLTHHPKKREGVWNDILHSQLMPQSLNYMLSVAPRTPTVSHALEIMVANTNIEYAKILIQHGIGDDSGLALARACIHGKKDMFDLIYPVSNPLKALGVEILRRRDWIEERMAAEQKEVLNASVSETLHAPSSMRAKKI